MKFYVLGEPEGKARPRVTKHGAYTPKKTKDYERQIRESYTMAGGEDYGKQPVSVTIQAVFGIPKSASKKKQREMEAAYILPKKKPDADNIAKVVCDALNGIAYHDDAQVVHCEVSKSYGLVARIIVEINPMKGEIL